MGLDIYAFTTAGAVEAEAGFSPETAALACIAPLAEALNGGTPDA